MMAMLRLALALVVLVFGAQAARAQPSPTRAWTVMVYMNGKNSLEEFALANFHAMAAVGSTPQVALVTELGRPKAHSKADGNWGGVYRFYMTRDIQPLPKSGVLVGTTDAARDMGKAATLSDFVAWAKRTYPAQHYMLIIWNHGQGYRLRAQAAAATRDPRAGVLGGVRAVSSDDDTGSIIYNSEIAGVIGKSFSQDKLDVLGFDACLMGMVETAYAVAPSTKVIVASEELEPGDGWQYAHWLDKLVANPAMSPTDLGRRVVDAYSYTYGDAYETTLSVIDLDGFRAMAGSLSHFADHVIAAGASERSALLRARAALGTFGDWYNPPQQTSVDLNALLANYEAQSHNASLVAESAALRATIKAKISYNYASSLSGLASKYGAAGVAIYFPPTLRAFTEDPFHTGYFKRNLDRPIAFVRDERWADLLYLLLDIPQ